MFTAATFLFLVYFCDSATVRLGIATAVQYFGLFSLFCMDEDRKEVLWKDPCTLTRLFHLLGNILGETRVTSGSEEVFAELLQKLCSDLQRLFVFCLRFKGFVHLKPLHAIMFATCH